MYSFCRLLRHPCHAAAGTLFWQNGAALTSPERDRCSPVGLFPAHPSTGAVNVRSPTRPPRKTVLTAACSEGFTVFTSPCEERHGGMSGPHEQTDQALETGNIGAAAMINNLLASVIIRKVSSLHHFQKQGVEVFSGYWRASPRKEHERLRR